MNAIELQNVSVWLKGALVLEDITLDIPVGDFAAVIGQNGAGKTTLIRVVLGTLRPSRGHVRLFGQPLASFHEWGRIGYIPQ
ncbi:MAG: ATP-binding cassette domain-containing protein, partial [Thermoplasmata archaeon]|nr:ATP-binding cassette domain-containing protein [Thermoplasmata archaeon]